MVKANGRRARIERAGVCSNNPLPKIGDLKIFILEVVFDELRHRPIEKDVPGLLVATKSLLNLFAGGRLTYPNISVSIGPQGISQPSNHVAHGAPTLDIARGKAADFCIASIIVIP